MKVYRTPGSSELAAGNGEPRCVVVAPGDPAAIQAAGEALGFDARVIAALARPGRSARADVTATGVVLTVWAASAGREPRLTTIAVTDRDLLALVEGPLGEEVAAAADRAADARAALAAAVLAVADGTEAYVDDLAAASDELGAFEGFFTGREREALVAQRARLLRVQHQCAAQHRVLTGDGALAAAVPDLQTAAERFAAAADSAAGAYAALGDALDDLRTTVSERLTLVSTVFLPLTLAGGFFGMNFGWMTDHLASGASFVLFGIVVPVLTTATTIFVIRRLSG